MLSTCTDVIQIPVDRLAKFCNPYKMQSWDNVTPITIAEVREAIDHSQLASKPYTGREGRSFHIQRIAYLVVNGWGDAIAIELGQNSALKVDNGNHRVAAAIYRGDRFIAVNIKNAIVGVKELLEVL